MIGYWQQKERHMEYEVKMSVANSILAQLGGRQFKVMTGAHSFVGGENFLQFQFPGNKRMNICRITLTQEDLYVMEFTKMRGVELVLVSEHDGLYFFDLARVFVEVTGLATHL
jgi:hypothetical protein